MLLSRLAENIYWAGRYLERAEATARLVKVHTELFLDMPRSVSLGWTPLLAVTGTGEAFAGSAGSMDEPGIVAFLTSSQANASSVVSCIVAARDNLRTVRALLPKSGWEHANSMYHWVNDTCAQAVPRRTRSDWLELLIRRCQTLSGMFEGTMTRDMTYAFLFVGRHLERADMTTRILDVQASTLLQDVGNPGVPYADVTWMAVLRSLSAMNAYRRIARAGVSGSHALNFLLGDTRFPRSVSHCLASLTYQLRQLPNCDAPLDAVDRARQRLDQAELDIELAAMPPEELHDFMDKLQADLGRIHVAASKAWFGRAITLDEAPAGGPGQSQSQSQSRDAPLDEPVQA